MVEIASILPASFTTLSGILTLAVSMIIAWIILMLSDKIIGHEIEAKHTLMISIIALFITPIVVGLLAQFMALPAVLSTLLVIYLLPLLVWVVLGEILIKDIDVTKKFLVMIVAFAVYTLVQMFAGLYISGFIAVYV